jgi:chemotaxis protein MotB
LQEHTGGCSPCAGRGGLGVTVPDDDKLAPVYIIKKKVAHAAHHGGAWKVAYADFVTAMMALFIVLWLLSTSEKVQKAVGGYFNDPGGKGKLSGTSMASVGETLSLSKDDMEKLKEQLEKAMKELPKFKELKDQVLITVTAEGLRVELLESGKGTFFESGNAHPSDVGKDILAKLAHEMGKLPNNIVIEGHTDSKPFSNNGEYSNWELSSDRANAARRLMEKSGLRQGQVKQVRGFADQKLRKPTDPGNASNRRISVIVQYQKAPAAASAAPEKKSDSPH